MNATHQVLGEVSSGRVAFELVIMEMLERMLAAGKDLIALGWGQEDPLLAQLLPGREVPREAVDFRKAPQRSEARVQLVAGRLRRDRSSALAPLISRESSLDAPRLRRPRSLCRTRCPTASHRPSPPRR